VRERHRGARDARVGTEAPRRRPSRPVGVAPAPRRREARAQEALLRQGSRRFPSGSADLGCGTTTLQARRASRPTDLPSGSFMCPHGALSAAGRGGRCRRAPGGVPPAPLPAGRRRRTAPRPPPGSAHRPRRHRSRRRRAWSMLAAPKSPGGSRRLGPRKWRTLQGAARSKARPSGPFRFRPDPTLALARSAPWNSGSRCPNSIPPRQFLAFPDPARPRDFPNRSLPAERQQPLHDFRTRSGNGVPPQHFSGTSWPFESSLFSGKRPPACVVAPDVAGSNPVGHPDSLGLP
jgi:hypothetical protein